MREDLWAAYEARRSLLEQVALNLETETKEYLAGLEHIDRVAFRAKGTSSFIGKVQRFSKQGSYTDPLVEIEDQIAGRVLVFFCSDITIVEQRLRQVLSAVEGGWREPARDEEFGYQSHHLVCLIPPQVKPAGWDQRRDVPNTFELQIRTLFIHAYAEPQHDLAYKGAGDLPKDIRRELAWIAASAWGADRAYERVRQWEEQRIDGDDLRP
jgi:putative GTP pyrophosphokinase